jgi:serine/threonine protein kinase
VKFYAIQIIDAVMDLHERNYVHRDLKLENILVDQKGYLKIIDFGVSKRLGTDLCTVTVVGTIGNMAPEQLESQKYSKSIDWWAVGIMLYELIFGYNPFNKEDEEMNIEEFREKVDEEGLNFPTQQE